MIRDSLKRRFQQQIHNIREQVRKRTGSLLFDKGLHGLAMLGRLHPHASPHRHGVEVLRDIPYTSSGLRDHTLDIYRPVTGMRRGPRPVVLYVHGGAFRILSKDTHWMMGLAFARRGYVVYNINYRLAPRHPFPAALMDCAAAFRWVVRHAHAHGGDPTRLVVAGESAGANLVTSLCICSAYRRPEPYAREIFDTDAHISAALPACGILQVSQSERFALRKKMPAWLGDRLREVSDAYLPRGPHAGPADLADPLLVLERGAPPDRPLPPFFVPVGTRDPLLDDTRRLKAALDRLGVPCEARYYPGEVHAFHAMVWRDNAKKCWQESFAFLRQHVPQH